MSEDEHDLGSRFGLRNGIQMRCGSRLGRRFACARRRAASIRLRSGNAWLGFENEFHAALGIFRVGARQIDQIEIDG